MFPFQVNGNTLFMTGSFKEFKVESRANDNWDEHNAVASTAVCLFVFRNLNDMQAHMLLLPLF